MERTDLSQGELVKVCDLLERCLVTQDVPQQQRCVEPHVPLLRDQTLVHFLEGLERLNLRVELCGTLDRGLFWRQ